MFQPDISSKSLAEQQQYISDLQTFIEENVMKALQTIEISILAPSLFIEKCRTTPTFSGEIEKGLEDLNKHDHKVRDQVALLSFFLSQSENLRKKLKILIVWNAFCSRISILEPIVKSAALFLPSLILAYYLPLPSETEVNKTLQYFNLLTN